MKKTILSIAMAVGFGTAQAGWISYDLDHVKADAKGGKDSQAHYIRAGGIRLKKVIIDRHTRPGLAFGIFKYFSFHF